MKKQSIKKTVAKVEKVSVEIEQPKKSFWDFLMKKDYTRDFAKLQANIQATSTDVAEKVSFLKNVNAELGLHVDMVEDMRYGISKLLKSIR